ncbi:MAG: 4'-phosphopantetheinyl transferase superfamily protein [Pirellulales bacterium]|nr:4'-phosphopantetheinyl transferase superfamily protein [Pirellulales bacterium]
MVVERHLTTAEFETSRATAAPRWLSASERQRTRQFRCAARRRQWLMGRWVAKLLVQEHAARRLPLADIHIESRDGRGRPAPPKALLRGAQCRLELAIAHSEHGATAALAPHGWTVGCDLTPCTAVASAVVRRFMTGHEQSWIAADAGPRAASVVWALKEATYKALGAGRPFLPAAWDGLAMLALHGVRLKPSAWRNDGPPIVIRSNRAVLRLAQSSGDVSAVVAFGPSPCGRNCLAAPAS